MKYTISTAQAFSHFIDITIETDCKSTNQIELQLPAWRPGRYELANYAKNLQQFTALDEKGNILQYRKSTKDCWLIDTANAEQLRIEYKYFAKQMDAGGSFVDEDICYINFINCLLFQPEKITQPCSLKLNINPEYKVACALEIQEQTIQASSFYELADSPLVASKELQQHNYTAGETKFIVWINGNVSNNQQQLLNDFQQFTQKQLELFGDFPEKTYHFLFHILPYPHYHGVEHAKSTVITLGPDTNYSERAFYSNLLGISSHELFHAWNVCKIRPKELLPYNFTEETYFETGYVAEGFTTYYGDLILARSGVYSQEEYFEELNMLFKRHYENFGRQNKSLAESSIDLWLDGYVAGIPNRKVSIYVKGAVVSLLLDLWIRKSTGFQKSLDDVLKLMWQDFGKKGKGYTSEDIKNLIDQVSGQNSEYLFSNYIFGTAEEEHELNTLLSQIGCSLAKLPNILDNERKFGFRVKEGNQAVTVDLIVPNSPAAEVLAEGDIILEINETLLNGSNFAELVKNKNELQLVVSRNYKTKTIFLPESSEEWLPTYKILKKENVSKQEKANFKLWLHQHF